MVLHPRPSSPQQAACVSLTLVAAEIHNNADDPGHFSGSVKENGDRWNPETFRKAGLITSPDNGPKVILPGLKANSHGAMLRCDV